MPASPVLKGRSDAIRDVFTVNESDNLLMSVTQSASFGSAYMGSPDNFDGSDLRITLSGSSDSMTFDLNGTGSFEKSIDDEIKRSEGADKEQNTKEPGRPPMPNHSSSFQMKFGRPPYQPHFQHPYYPQQYSAPQGGHPNYPYYFYPQQTGYHNHHTNPNTKDGQHSSSNHNGISSSANRQENSQPNSSNSSLNSTGSRKRTFDDSLDEIHPGQLRSSNSSVCTAPNDATTAVNKLVKESPVKKPVPDTMTLSRMNSTDSADSALTFGGCSLNEKENKKSTQRQKSELSQFMLPSPFNGGTEKRDASETQTLERFTFDLTETRGKPSEAPNGFTPLNQMNNLKSETQVKKESPNLNLNIDSIQENISWNVEGDDMGNTPLSFGSELSGNFFGVSLKSPGGNFVGLGSPSSLGDALLDDSTPLEYQEPSKLVSQTPGKQYLQTPSTPMNFSSPFHAAMFNSAHSGRYPMGMFSPAQGMYHPHGERVVNLRGKAPLQGSHPAMHLPPNVPSHHNFLASPIGLPNRGQYMMNMPSPMPNSRQHELMHSPASFGISKERCIAMEQPLPTKYQGDIEADKDAAAPEFTALVNFPGHVSMKQSVSLPEGMRCCVMCGKACRCTSAKAKKNESKMEPVNKRNSVGDIPIIPTQNKGLCTSCDVNVWIVQSSGLQIKWCKGCKNFRPWAAFGDKGLATKCVRCRDRQREKYASQKDRSSKR